MTSAELINAGVRPQLLAWLALRRACGGGIAKSGDHYYEWGHPTPSYLAGVFEELVSTGLLALTERDPWGLRRVRLTAAGELRYRQYGRRPMRLDGRTSWRRAVLP